MASLIVSPLLELLIEKVASALTKEIGLLRGVKKDMRKLLSLLSTINEVLKDAEMRSAVDKPLSNWLKKLKDAAYDADDVVDEFQTEVLRQQMEKKRKLKGQVQDFFSSSHNPIIFRHMIAKNIKDVLERFDEIAEERNKFQLTTGFASTSCLSIERETNSIELESEVVARASEKEKILNFLINEENDKALSVFPIVGLGGLGKTTLAKLAYNDDRLKSVFDLQMWVCVSEEFVLKDIVTKIIENINKSKCDNLQLEVLSKNLQEVLGGKRFFLVLDDVWNEESDKWEGLRALLRCGKKGSKIVSTTRSSQVARVMGSVLPFHLTRLSLDDCWTIFRERAFGMGREKETPELVKIGMQILTKCGGLPLAAKALGSLLGTKRGEAEWLAVKDNEIWRLPEEEDRILPVLKLSYYHLPSYLKQCFVYCSLFPKDFNYNKKKLIRLWIGEGFVTSLNNGMLLDDVGNQYFNNLLSRSFFQEAEKDKFGDIVMCKMHDLVHDLSCSIAKGEFYMTMFHEKIELGSYRYISLTFDSIRVLNIPCENLNLRSLILSNSRKINELNWDVLVRQRRLRLLDLGWTSLPVLPPTICRLHHLRFLDLSNSEIIRLPETIGSLYNLSTLILGYCFKLEELPGTITCLQNLFTLALSGCLKLVQLPSGLSNMSNLKHLDLDSCNGLSGMAPGMGQMSSIVTLSKFIVGEEDGCHITELRHLNQIRGSLEISSLELVRKPTEAEEADIRKKTGLKRLDLIWGRRGEERANVEETEEESVIENLKTPPNLVSLRIDGYMGSRLPSWIMSSSSSLLLFENLVEIALCGLKRCECIPCLGHLPCLKRLEVVGMDGVRRIGEEEFNEHIIERRGGGSATVVVLLVFPVLEELKFKNMLNLEEWVVMKEAASTSTGGGGDIIIKRENMFPSLKKLRIWDCPKLRSVQPGLPLSVVELWIERSMSEELTIWGSSSLGGLSKVKCLEIKGIEATVLESSSFPEGLQCLTSLEQLKIYCCEELTNLPEGLIQLHIPTLRSLELVGNIKLTSLGGSEQQEQMPPLLFTSLHHLNIQDCYEISALPEWVGCLTSLQYLLIERCPKMEMLPDGVQHLTSLQSLGIFSCPKLEMLPDGVQRLTSLDELAILGCPILQRRCKRDTGEEWHKISRIPNLYISLYEEEEEENRNERNNDGMTTCQLQ